MVPNRSNYIHWIEDLLSSDIIPKTCNNGDNVKGFDIGTGANCIYPLLGASLLGWSFVGSDVTDVALEWVEKNVTNNPHISELIEIRKVESCSTSGKESDNGESACVGVEKHAVPSSSSPFTMDHLFFLVWSGMVGEKAFISRIIEDSVAQKQTLRWFTSMVGQKLNLKILTSKLWEVGATVVKTTEFVQGQACRWDHAWTFMPPTRKIISPRVIEKKNSSFMLEITASKDHCNANLKNEVNDVNEAPSDKHLQETSSSSGLSANPWNISGERIFTALRYPIPRIILINIPTIGGRSES